jgi:hypothetical protein
MSTQVLDQVTSTSSLSADQLARAAAFAQQELQHANDAPAVIPPKTGAGTITYSITLTENSGGFGVIGWVVNDTLETYSIQAYDWVGVFTNRNQALVNPNGNFLGGSGGWTQASNSSPFTTDVALQDGMVAAYIIKNAAGAYVPVAVSAPFKSPDAAS